MKAAVHRGWISLKSAAAVRDSKAILEECERGEDYAKAKYGEALRQGLPPPPHPRFAGSSSDSITALSRTTIAFGICATGIGPESFERPNPGVTQVDVRRRSWITK